MILWRRILEVDGWRNPVLADSSAKPESLWHLGHASGHAFRFGRGKVRKADFNHVSEAASHREQGVRELYYCGLAR
jgi:hypothetical protein